MLAIATFISLSYLASDAYEGGISNPTNWVVVI